MNPGIITRVCCVAVVLGITGCQTTGPQDLLRLPADTLEKRAIQTRLYDAVEERTLVSASAAVLQDLGFGLQEADYGLGLVVGAKRRTAVEPGQVAVAILLTLLVGELVPWDKEQLIRASVVTRPLDAEGIDRHAVRLTLQRTVWDTNHSVSRVEAIHDPELFQAFFERLSKSIFLEIQEL